MNISNKHRLTGLEDKAPWLSALAESIYGQATGTAWLSVSFIFHFFMLHNCMTQTYWRHWLWNNKGFWTAPCDSVLTWLPWGLILTVNWWTIRLCSRLAYTSVYFTVPTLSSSQQVIKDLRRNPAHVSPVGFIVNKTSHRPHVWNTKRFSAFTTCRWLSVMVCDNKLCVTVSLNDAMAYSRQMFFMN